MTKQFLRVLLGAVLLLGCAAAQADTALVHVTPRNLEANGFRVAAKTRRNRTVEFVIRRNISGIDGPGRKGYLSQVGDKNLGTPVRLHEEPGKRLTFRFTLPEEKVAGAIFTLWGQGLRGEGVTHRLRLADFAKPRRE